MTNATDQSRAQTRAQLGMTAPVITVETHLPGGLPGFTLVGLPATAVREARDRVKSAITNCGLDFPLGRVLVNLAPADLAKDGTRLDLAIAVSVLSATGQVPWSNVNKFEFLGELGLGGAIRAVRGSLCAALSLAKEGGDKRLVAPLANQAEFAMAPPDTVIPMGHLQDVVALLRNDDYRPRPQIVPATATASDDGASLEQIMGQQAAKRALTIAAAGGHHMLLVGPPGTGKTLLARSLRGLLPALSETAARDVAAIYSAAGIVARNPFLPPFRDPHHSATAPAMVGGGTTAQPGEISLAHRGVLFLDELPHFKPSILDLLREPLETQSINLVRSGYRATFPAGFQLIAAMNPCPAGNVCDADHCRCTAERVRRYQSRVSGPLLDRIDMHVPVPPVPEHLLLDAPAPTSDAGQSRQQVRAAQARQIHRQGGLNSSLAPASLGANVVLDEPSRALLVKAGRQFPLSARGIHRVLTVARSSADLAAAARVAAAHVAEAVSFRAIDWGAAA